MLYVVEKRDKTMSQVVAYKRLKTKENYKPSALKVVVVAYEDEG